MTLYIDDALMTAQVRIPLTEGWLETDIPFEVRKGLVAADVGPGDVALIAAPESTLLGRTHVIATEVAVVAEAISAIAMRTPVRPDGVDETPIRMLDAGPTAEVLIRALLRPFFGITATTFVTSDEDEGAADAQVVVVDGALGLTDPEAGFHEDLARAWFVLTGQAVVHYVLVVGVEVEARGPEPEIALLQQAVQVGQERRRDVRRMIAEADEAGLDRDRLADLTNRTRFELTAEDRQSLRNLLARGTWGSRFLRTLPVFRDEVAEAEE
jgi:predicted solute-binding protein